MATRVTLFRPSTKWLSNVENFDSDTNVSVPTHGALIAIRIK